MIHTGQICEACGEDFWKSGLGYPRCCKNCLGEHWSETLVGVYCEKFTRIHERYAGRVHFWPTRQRWWDEITGEKGTGARPFRRHVKKVLALHAQAQREMAKEMKNGSSRPE